MSKIVLSSAVLLLLLLGVISRVRRAVRKSCLVETG